MFDKYNTLLTTVIVNEDGTLSNGPQLENPPVFPNVGDMIPLNGRVFVVAQRAYIPEISTIQTSTGPADKRVVIECTLVERKMNNAE